MLRNKVVRFKKIYKLYFEHFLIKCTVFVLIVKNVIKNQKFNFQVKLCDIVRFKTICKFYFDHLFKSKSSDIVLLKLGNLHQNAKRYEARNTEREARRPLGRAPYRRAHSF